MIKLSERLKGIADFIEIGESMADIGTDHGFLPIYLWENKISPKVILSDINQGPLEKASQNIIDYNLKSTIPIDTEKDEFQLRKGSGIDILNAGEVDDIVIAGMGGKLIIDILGFDLKKTKSYKKFILQPRTGPEKLRKWLILNEFSIIDEVLVREGKYIWEIIVAFSSANMDKNNSNDSNDNNNSNDNKDCEESRFEISPILIKKKDPLLNEFIKQKLRITNNIIESLKNSKDSRDSEEKIKELKKRIRCLESML